jgi:shikimate 5-dehydrogenase
MKIDADTKIIGRFHKKPSPRGLNIYNPFFEEAGINATYLLFYNQDPKVLFDGLRNLNLAGAITAGFEGDQRLMDLVDQCEEMSKYLGAIGHVVNDNGIVKGFTQGGEAFHRTIYSATTVTGKKLVLVGAGKIAKGLLFHLSRSKIKPASVEIYNRTVDKAKSLKLEYSFVTNVGSLQDLAGTSGDILANVSHLGGSVEDNLFTKDIVKKYQAVADITFETENTNLIELAKKCNKQFATGWDMFTFQGQIALENILKTKIPFDLLKKHVRRGLGEEVR